MIYDNIKKAKFISRPNRFIAHIEIDGNKEVCHVKNTGRCKELLVPDANIYVQKNFSALRKTKYDLISVLKADRLINIDSSAPNKVFYEYMAKGNFLPGITKIKPESKFLNSRFDFYIEYADKKAFVEVKGVTLEEKGVVLFPDAPTERGVKHINELIECKKAGYEAFVVFVIQMDDVHHFTPNIKTHPQFAKALKKASKKGVNIFAVDCIVTDNSLNIGKEVKVVL